MNGECKGLHDDSCARVYHTEAGIATGGFVGPFTPAMRAEASQGHTSKWEENQANLATSS